jgi:transposase-like protein
MIRTIEVQERLQTQSFKNLPQELQRFLITGKGKYMQLNPNCPHCESINVVQNGYYECESKLIKSLGLSIKHGHCLCKTCGKTFSTKYPELEKFLNDLHRFLAETCFRLFVRGLSFGAIAEYIKEDLGILITDETAHQYYKEMTGPHRRPIRWRECR